MRTTDQDTPPPPVLPSARAQVWLDRVADLTKRWSGVPVPVPTAEWEVRQPTVAALNRAFAGDADPTGEATGAADRVVLHRVAEGFARRITEDPVLGTLDGDRSAAHHLSAGLVLWAVDRQRGELLAARLLPSGPSPLDERSRFDEGRRALVESFTDELGARSRRDPDSLRLDLLRADPAERTPRVVELIRGLEDVGRAVPSEAVTAAFESAYTAAVAGAQGGRGGADASVLGTTIAGVTRGGPSTVRDRSARAVRHATDGLAAPREPRPAGESTPKDSPQPAGRRPTSDRPDRSRGV